MTPDTATNQECRDYIAECRGWRRIRSGAWAGDLLLPIGTHPIDDNLDAAYAALPPGWRWEVHQDPRGGKPDIWRVSANQNHHDGGTGWLTVYSEDLDHKLALLRAACKAWAVVRGKESKA